MTRNTSIEAYNFITKTGIVSKRRAQVYKILYRHGPMTAAQVVECAKEFIKVSNSGNFATRLSELRQMGIVQEVGKGPCPLTNRTVIFWDVTSKLPTKLKRRTSNAIKIKRLKKAVMFLERWVEPEVKAVAESIMKGGA